MMIWLAIAVEAAQASWVDFGVLLTLQVRAQRRYGGVSHDMYFLVDFYLLVTRSSFPSSFTCFPLPLLLYVYLYLLLQVLNGGVSYYEEKNAGDAIAALKQRMTPSCVCRRDGAWDADFDTAALVPGDLVRLKVRRASPALATG